ncbi:Tat pathway signal protein [Streptomyces sp. NPDC059477]|uniref:Tat pathway signal protein n=1 Tax=Streptomyces sp. NPDC059477 TaxID=3346847 RepID=UPI0036B48CAB
MTGRISGASAWRTRRERRARALARSAGFAAFLSLLASLLTLSVATPAAATATAAAGTATGTGTGTATGSAADAPCAALPLAPFGDPGDALGKATVPVGQSACFSVTATAAGEHLLTVHDPAGDLHAQLTAADGTPVDCYEEEFQEDGRCRIPAAGDYTVTVTNSGWDTADVSLTLVPLGAATDGCFAPAGTGWDQPTAARSAGSPVQIDCQPFTGEPGERVLLSRSTKVYGGVVAWITDGTGARICPRFAEDGAHSLSCVLPGDGPYRVLSRVTDPQNGFPAEYAVRARSLSDPQGCRTASVRPFGPIEGLDFQATPCFTFTVDKARDLLVHAVDAESAGPVMVFDPAGKIACYAIDPCELPAAGRYTAVLEESYLFGVTDDDLLLLDRASAAGCVPVGTGLYRGELRSAGQYDCLTLDLPQGARMAALTPSAASGVDIDVEVFDRTGTAQCSATQLTNGDCALTGTAPYRVLVHTEDSGEYAVGPYSVALYRTDAANDCPVLPAGSFAAGGAEAAFSTGDGVFAQCFAVPAGTRARTEVFQLTAVSGAVPARFSVLDGSGRSVCEVYSTTSGWTACSLTAGQRHTVLVTGRDQAAGYTLTRRDVTASAASAGCAKSAAVQVGGPSLKGTSGAAGTLTCHQITTGAATDVVHVDVRDAQGSANIVVFAGDGTVECSFRNRSCAVTGSTTHQVLVQTPARLTAAPGYRLDALRIGTAAGPAPECTRVPSVAYGYGPITGTLDESRTAVCAVLPTAGLDRFNAEITDTTGATTTAVPALYSSTWSNGCVRYVPTGWQCAASESSAVPGPSVFLLGLPEQAAGTAYRARLNCFSSLCGPDKVAVTAVSPTTGASGTRTKVTVTGTALGPGTEVRLSLNGRTIKAVADSVAPDHRSVTATLDLTGAAPGSWNVSVYAGCCEFSRGTFTVTPPQLTSTAPPKVTGTAKVGAKVTAAPGSWSATPTSYTYQWKTDGRAISGATGQSYTVPAAALGKKLTVSVTALRSGWQSGSATSAAVTVAKGDAPKATKAPVISGTAKVGRTLKATKGTWTPAPTSYTYQWYANGAAIGGATKSSLVLKSAQKGKKITVKVVAKRTGHKDGSSLSKPTKAVVK